MDRQRDGQVDDGGVEGREIKEGWTNQRINGELDGWTMEQMDRWMDR